MSGSITYEGTYTDNFGRRRTESLTLGVSLKYAPADSLYAAQFINDASSYSATMSSHSELGPDAEGCIPTFEGRGAGGGGGLEDDEVVGNSRPGHFTVAASVRVQVGVDEDWCALGQTHSTREDIIQLPDCEGTESPGSSTARTYVFGCTVNSPNEQWVVSGQVTVR